MKKQHGDKYATKSRPMRFFHRYTGYIVMSIFLAIMFSIYFYYDSTLYYFEKWLCPEITGFAKTDGHLSMIEDEHMKFHEILQGCFDSEQFVGDETH